MKHRQNGDGLRGRTRATLAGLGLLCTGVGVGASLAGGARSAAPAGTAMPRFGINLSGAEARGGDSLRPTSDDLRLAIGQQGFDLIRYPFKPDRMTPARIRELRGLTDRAGAARVPVILDRHDFGWPPVVQQIDWWTSFARNFPDDGSVLLDLENEPKGVGWMQWAADAKQVIAGLRGRGIRHPILLEWPRYASIGRFDRREPAGAPCISAGCALDRTPGKLDPIGQTFLNGHRYFDDDGSGTKAACLAKDGSPRTESGFGRFAAQLRKRGLKGYITETAFGGYAGIPASCQAVGADAIADLRANGDVLLGVTWWGGGRLWPDSYPFKIDCTKGERTTCQPSAYLRMIRPAKR